jgi:hypothetical protein
LRPLKRKDIDIGDNGDDGNVSQMGPGIDFIKPYFGRELFLGVIFILKF